MNELHDEFAAWIAAGTRDELPRDLALHASGCDGCMRQTAAFDALERVDLGAALPPPIRAAAIRRIPRPLQLGRAAGGALVVVIVLGVGAMAGSTIFRSRVQLPTSAPAPGAAQASPAEGVLGGVPAFTPSPTASPSSEPSPSPSANRDATPAVPSPTPRPTIAGNLPPVATAMATPPSGSPPPVTPAPTTAPTPAPTTSSSASPSVAPTPTPMPTPTPEPSPTPTPSPMPT